MKGRFKTLAVLAALLVALGAVLHSQGFKNADLFLFGHRGDTSISRLAAGSLSIGQGGDQDYSGQLTLSPAELLPVMPQVVCGDGFLTPPVQGVCCVGASYDFDNDPHSF